MTEQLHGSGESRIETAKRDIESMQGRVLKLTQQGNLGLIDKVGIDLGDAVLLEAELRGMSRFAQFVLNSDERVEDIVDEIGTKYSIRDLGRKLTELDS